MLLRVSSLSSPTEWLPLCDDVSLVEVVAMVVVLDFFCRVTGFIRTEKKEEEDDGTTGRRRCSRGVGVARRLAEPAVLRAKREMNILCSFLL